MQIFFKIVVPISKPVIATIGMFIAFGVWNDWFTAKLYISDGDLYMYDGKDKKMVCSDVDMFWAKEQLTAEASIYGS